MKVQVFSKSNEGSLMTWLTVNDKWNNQQIIDFAQRNLTPLELNIMWIKVGGKKIIDNNSKKLKDKSSPKKEREG